MMQFGIEHEVALLHNDGRFADFTNTSYADVSAIIDVLPRYENDYPRLRIGDMEIKVKRWYVDGFERYRDDGSILDCPVKGIEIRTTPHDTIAGALAELIQSYRQLRTAAAPHFRPTWVSFNPVQTVFIPNPPLTPFEQSIYFRTPEGRTAASTNVTYGPDLNLSLAPLPSAERLIDIGRKLTAYSPFIVPFSFSSPFYDGRLWDGLSVRTFYRTGPRPACLVFLSEKRQLISTTPSLTKLARQPTEVGRIEFKAFDTCHDPALYAALFALLKGLILDTTLTARSETPDAVLHQRVAVSGFQDRDIRQTTRQILAASAAALANDPDAHHLALLQSMLAHGRTPAHTLREHFERTHSIPKTLAAYESLDV